MAKKPKTKWQINVRSKLEFMGIGYQELADRMGEREGSIRQVMCQDNMPRLRDKICNYLGVELEEKEKR
ncbi:hypothetical protein ACPW7J_09670 [Ihubacter sp. rT4E-8]|uniref:hypothetical protein n=1 Tax=Ihubacter sp. rT4E-8 TaxID=3242369 RepID=UPI003CFA36B3